MYDDMNLKDLKELAEKRGVKVEGRGWSTCCPPNGNKADIIMALERHGGGSGGKKALEKHGGGGGGMYYDDMNLKDLKELAEKRGIKVEGKGWPTCCPPNGNKADIIKALEKHGGGGGGKKALEKHGGGGGGMYYDDMNLEDLKDLAEEREIKVEGKGWSTCCPPNGNQADIIMALEKHGGGGGYDIVQRMNTVTISSLHFIPSQTIAALRYRREDITGFIQQNRLNEDVVMRMYTENHIYKELNASLNTGNLTQYQKQFTMLLGDAIYRIIERLPKTVFRGLKLGADVLKEYKEAEGRTIYWYGFTSTSRDKDTAKTFGPVLVEIELETGNRDHVANMTAYSKYDEAEVLISANAGFFIERVDVAKRYMKLSLVDNEHCPKWDRD